MTTPHDRQTDRQMFRLLLLSTCGLLLFCGGILAEHEIRQWRKDQWAKLDYAIKTMVRTKAKHLGLIEDSIPLPVDGCGDMTVDGGLTVTGFDSVLKETIEPVPYQGIVFDTDGGESRLYWDKEQRTLCFEGDVDASAQLFFDAVVAKWAEGMGDESLPEGAGNG